MTDLLGPATANAVTSRPADTRTFGSDDTFLKNCSAPGVQDGTKLDAGFFNGLLQQVRRAIRGMGITADNADDDMLLKAIKASSSSAVYSAAVNLPIFPEIRNTGGRFTASASTGSVVIDAGQGFVWRGLISLSTDLFVAGARTFSTVANKTYHLRWHAPGVGLATPAASYPNGRFVLRDLADAAYNALGNPETHVSFDTAYDDMLIARVVTNGANALTVTTLANLAFLRANFYKTTFEVSVSDPGTYLTPTYNWSRTPDVALVSFSTNATLGVEMLNSVDLTDNTRYAGKYRSWGYLSDFTSFVMGQLQINARA